MPPDHWNMPAGKLNVAPAAPIVSVPLANKTVPAPDPVNVPV